jgi:hypothetical protein
MLYIIYITTTTTTTTTFNILLLLFLYYYITFVTTIIIIIIITLIIAIKYYNLLNSLFDYVYSFLREIFFPHEIIFFHMKSWCFSFLVVITLYIMRLSFLVGKNVG